jgi:hypothetical protein
VKTSSLGFHSGVWSSTSSSSPRPWQARSLRRMTFAEARWGFRVSSTRRSSDIKYIEFSFPHSGKVSGSGETTNEFESCVQMDIFSGKRKILRKPCLQAEQACCTHVQSRFADFRFFEMRKICIFPGNMNAPGIILITLCT